MAAWSIAIWSWKLKTYVAVSNWLEGLMRRLGLLRGGKMHKHKMFVIKRSKSRIIIIWIMDRLQSWQFPCMFCRWSWPCWRALRFRMLCCVDHWLWSRGRIGEQEIAYQLQQQHRVATVFLGRCSSMLRSWPSPYQVGLHISVLWS